MSENETDRKPVAGPTPPLSKAKKQTNRRRFLRTTLLTGGVTSGADFRGASLLLSLSLMIVPFFLV